MKWIALGMLSLLSSAVCAESFCGAERLSKVESKICGDSELRKLDAQLNSVYHRAEQAAENLAMLRKDQRLWLTTVRDKCPDAQCLNREYRLRIFDMGDLVALSETLNASEMNGEEAKAVCLGIADLYRTHGLESIEVAGRDTNLMNGNKVAPTSLLAGESIKRLFETDFSGMGHPLAIYNLRIGRGKTLTQFGAFSTGGTCPSTNVYNLSYLADRQIFDNGIDDVPDPDEEIRWTVWGDGEWPAIYQGRPIVIAGFDLPKMISWIKPDGRIRPLCLLKPRLAKKEVVSSKDGAKELCSEISRGTISPEPWIESTKSIPLKDESQGFAVLSQEMFGFYAEAMKSQFIDIDGDGNLEYVANFYYDSGAGCGSHREWLAELTEKRDAIKQSDVNGGLRFIEGQSVALFHFGDEYIAEVSDEKHVSHVLRLKSGPPEEICVLRDSTELEIEKLFNLE